MHPVETLGKRLLSVEKPARYLGGEQGAVRKPGDLYTVALCFPDLYEIGMSNNAMRILYAGLNALPGVRCERVFAPARDFEDLLRESGTPLYTLESGIPLSEVDMLAFTVGYELAATNMLTVLDLGGIPLDASSRGDGHPVVIAGGPAVTNPLPLSRFLDAVWIGEAEAGFFAFLDEVSRVEHGRPGREEILCRLKSQSAFWMPGKTAVRAVDMEFPDREYPVGFPWPSLKPVQDHGTVEIMRGCPNGCRFCHAGYFYRPQRVRSPERIFREVESLVLESGYREITLSSLSSGDYPGIVDLVRSLNRTWGGRRVSFQLPSLKVESLELEVLEELTHTRKSGLTFAVETPEEAWQRSINKSVTLEKILSILKEAENHGYRLAKFYFMIGLPVQDISGLSEAEAMIEFLRRLLGESRFQLNVNIGTFIPKPHTPFQWCPQISEEEALSRIRRIRESFRYERRIKISYHTPFISQLEGILSRGDARVGDLILSAWRNGARLDAWEDLMDKDAWLRALEEILEAPIREALDGRSTDEPLPWDEISLRIGRGFLKREWDKARAGSFSRACTDHCTENCGTCNDTDIVVYNKIQPIMPGSSRVSPDKAATMDSSKNPVYRLVMRYSKSGSASFLPHHSIIDLLYRAFQLSGIPIAFSQGFNPLPRLEIEDPIPLGMSSLEDYASVLLTAPVNPSEALERLNRFLPPDIQVQRTAQYPILEKKRNRSISSMLWGSDYRLEGVPDVAAEVVSEFLADPRLEGSTVLECTEKDGLLCFRLRSVGIREIGFGSLFEKTFHEPFLRSPVLATRIRQWAQDEKGPVDFFKAFDAFYGMPVPQETD